MVVKADTVPMPMDVDVCMKTEKSPSSAAIKEKLLAIMTETKFVDYDNYQLNLEDEAASLVCI